MAAAQIMIGNDVPMRTFQITDGETPANNIPISDINDIKINVYRRTEHGAKVNVAVFRLTPVGDNGEIIVVDDANGKVGFIVNREITLKCPIGILYAEIEVQLNEGSEYISSLVKLGGDGYEVCEIIESSNPVTEI